MILTIFFGILGFGIMVFVHEFGHFLAAKLVGIQVEVFSLGWGGKMVGFDRGGTSYQLSWFPVGGYCKMKGDDPLKSTSTSNHSAEGRPEQGEGSFFAASPWKRIVTAAAGPSANILFAVLVLTIIWRLGFDVYSDPNRIVVAADYTLDSIGDSSPAVQSGLMTGDRIVEIDGAKVESFQDILQTVSVSPRKQLAFAVERAGQLMLLDIVPDLDLQTGAGRIGVYAWRDPVVDEVRADGAAYSAQIQSGDRIIKLDGSKINHTIDFYQAISDGMDEVELVVLRDGREQTMTLPLLLSEEGMPDPGMSFQLHIYRSQPVNIAGAVLKGLDETWNTLALTVKGIALLFQGVNLRNAVAGPLRITYYVGSVATSGFSLGISEGLISFFRFLCLLSVVLFLMNLLPLPALDGGQIIVFLLEIVRGRPVDPKIVSRIQVVGFSLLIILAIFVTFSDILYFMGR